MKNPKYIHEIKLKGETDFERSFNECSDLWAKSIDETLTEQERKEAQELFMQKRQCLELGIK